MDPVILKDKPDLGLTIVEKLEHYGRNCAFALVLLTADDETASGDYRARQNVIHELGYFHGRLGRRQVVLLKEIGVELFSNISGLIYKEFPRGDIESIFRDVTKAIESGDASAHADSVPIADEGKGKSEFSDGDWITAAVVAPEKAETALKQVAHKVSRKRFGTRETETDAIVEAVEAEIKKTRTARRNIGSSNESRSEACIAWVVSELLERELHNFTFEVTEWVGKKPLEVFRETIAAFVKNEKNKYK